MNPSPAARRTESRKAGIDTARALAREDVWIVHNDSPEWRELTAGEFEGMRRKVVVDRRRILNREAVRGVELTVLGG